MTAISTPPSVYQNYVGAPLETAATLSEQTNVYLKAIKMVSKIIFFAKECFGNLSAPLINIASSLQSSVSVIETFSILTLIADLIAPDKKGETFFQTTSFFEAKCWQKVMLFVHSCFKCTRAVVTYGRLSAAFMAKCLIGQLPLFRLVLDGTYAVSCTFGVIDLVKTLNGLTESKLKEKEAELASVRVALLSSQNGEVLLETDKSMKDREIKLVDFINTRDKKLAGATMNIAINLLKIVVIVIGLSLAVFASFVSGYYIAATVAPIALSGLSALADTLGFVKVIAY